MHIIGETYRETSTKSSEREKRGSFSKVSKYYGPQKFHKFLQSGHNNTRLIELLFEYLQLNKDDLLQTLKSDDLVLLSDNSCVVVSNAAVMEDLNLPSDQEETDRKIILHCANILQRNHGVNVCVWSPSGYT